MVLDEVHGDLLVGLLSQVVEELQDAGVQQVALVFVLYKDVDDGSKKVFLDQIHDKCVVFGTDDSFEELYDADVEDLGLEALQLRDLLHDILLDGKYPETVGMLLCTFCEKLNNYLPRVI